MRVHCGLSDCVNNSMCKCILKFGPVIVLKFFEFEQIPVCSNYKFTVGEHGKISNNTKGE